MAVRIFTMPIFRILIRKRKGHIRFIKIIPRLKFLPFPFWPQRKPSKILKYVESLRSSTPGGTLTIEKVVKTNGLTKSRQ